MKFIQSLLIVAISIGVSVADKVTVTVTPTVFETVTVTAESNAVQATKSAKSTQAKQTTTLAPERTSEVASVTSSQSETSGSTSSTSSTSGNTFSGDGTYYEVGGADGACGEMHSDSEMVVAIGHGIYDSVKSSSNVSNYCGKKINASYNGKTVQVTVVDRCEACTDTDLDFSPSAFDSLASESLGRIKITWDWA